MLDASSSTRHAVSAVKVGLVEQCLSCRTSSGQAAEPIRRAADRMLGQPAAASACSARLPGIRSARALSASVGGLFCGDFNFL